MAPQRKLSGFAIDMRTYQAQVKCPIANWKCFPTKYTLTHTQAYTYMDSHNLYNGAIHQQGAMAPLIFFFKKTELYIYRGVHQTAKIAPNYSQNSITVAHRMVQYVRSVAL